MAKIVSILVVHQCFKSVWQSRHQVYKVLRIGYLVSQNLLEAFWSGLCLKYQSKVFAYQSKLIIRILGLLNLVNDKILVLMHWGSPYKVGLLLWGKDMHFVQPRRFLNRELEKWISLMWLGSHERLIKSEIFPVNLFWMETLLRKLSYWNLRYWRHLVNNLRYLLRKHESVLLVSLRRSKCKLSLIINRLPNVILFRR